MRVTIISLFFFLLALACQTHVAASSTTIGNSDAANCFQESQYGLSSNSLEYCDRAIRSGDLTRRDLAATYSNRGIIYSNLGQYSKALEDHNRAIEISPALAEAYINRGNVYYHTRDYEKALTDYDMASKLGASPAHTPLYNKGLTLMRLKRYEEARLALGEALELSPDARKIKQRLDELEGL